MSLFRASRLKPWHLLRSIEPDGKYKARCGYEVAAQARIEEKPALEAGDLSSLCTQCRLRPVLATSQATAKARRDAKSTRLPMATCPACGSRLGSHYLSAARNGAGTQMLYLVCTNAFCRRRFLAKDILDENDKLGEST